MVVWICYVDLRQVRLCSFKGLVLILTSPTVARFSWCWQSSFYSQVEPCYRKCCVGCFFFSLSSRERRIEVIGLLLLCWLFLSHNFSYRDIKSHGKEWTVFIEVNEVDHDSFNKLIKCCYCLTWATPQSDAGLMWTEKLIGTFRERSCQKSKM